MTNLTIGYGKHGGELTLFQDLNLNLPGGSMVCFMGPNGVGKSTLIRTLAGLHQPISGRVHLQRITAYSKSVIPFAVSVVLTDRISSANLTVRELITYGRYPHLSWTLRLSKADHGIVEKAISDLKLHDLTDKKIYTLSDGQMQMAMIARAMAQDTKVMLLDEPTAHLDLNNRVEIMNLLRTVAHRSGKAILVATHELDLALQTADFIWLAGESREIITGIPEDLVLNDSFDRVFQFKGFDLKTGKVQHEPFRDVTVTLTGTGPVYLWTKNALERNGYSVVASQSSIEVEAGDMTWHLKAGDQTNVLYNIGALLELLQSFAIR